MPPGKSATATSRAFVNGAGAVLLAVAVVVAGACDLAADGGAASSPGARSVADTLLAPSVEVGYTLGDPDAPVAVVEFSDFGCPYCGRFARTTMPDLHREYIDTGLVRWRYVPVVFGFPGGDVGGAAAVCAAQHGDESAFWRTHDMLYTRQVVLRGGNARPQVLDWLEEIGLDRDLIEACMDDPSTMSALERNNQVAQQWMVRGTPTFLINGVPMSGALPLDFFRQVLGAVLDPSGL